MNQRMENIMRGVEMYKDCCTLSTRKSRVVLISDNDFVFRIRCWQGHSARAEA